MRNWVMVVLLLCIGTILTAQELDDTIIDELFETDDEVLADLWDEVSSYHFIYATLNYSNNTLYSGRKYGEKQYSILPQVFYLHSKGWVLGIAGNLYQNGSPVWSSTILTAGFSKTVGSKQWLNYRFSFDKYFFSNADSIEPSFTSSLNVGMTFKTRTIGWRNNFSLLLGNETSFQYASSAYARLNLIKFSKYNKLTFEPQVTLSFGDETALVYQPGRQIGQYTLPPVASYQKIWGLMNTQFQIPLDLSLGNFDFELGYNYNIPRALGDDDQLPQTSFINFSIGYFFSL